MAVRKKIHKIELTDKIGTKDCTAIVNQDTAKIICKDPSGNWTFNTIEINQYIEFLEAVREQIRENVNTLNAEEARQALLESVVKGEKDNG